MEDLLAAEVGEEGRNVGGRGLPFRGLEARGWFEGLRFDEGDIGPFPSDRC